MRQALGQQNQGQPNRVSNLLYHPALSHLCALREHDDLLDERRPVVGRGPVVGGVGRVDDLEDAAVGGADEEDVVGLAGGRRHLRVHRDLPELDGVPAATSKTNDKLLIDKLITIEYSIHGK